MSEQLPALPSQTIGPFYHFALTAGTALGRMDSPDMQGERIRLRLRLLDGDGAPVPDAMIELWQADSNGRYQESAGFGRLATDSDGVCLFETVRPGPVSDGLGGVQASHISVSIFARGLLGRLATRIYFAGDANLDSDPVLGLVPASRRATLLAEPGNEAGQWNLDIRLQGENETVFFDL